MIWHKTDVYTVEITREDDYGRTSYRPVIHWLNARNRGPKVHSEARARQWAAQRICTRLGDAAVEICELEGAEVMSW